jgi:hypothetical protein
MTQGWRSAQDGQPMLAVGVGLSEKSLWHPGSGCAGIKP